MVNEQFLTAAGVAHAIAHVLGGKDALKKFRQSLEKSYGMKGSGSSPIDELRKRLRGLVPVNGVK